MSDHIKAPGLKWRRRAKGQVAAYWIARDDLVKRGYQPRTVPIHFDAEDPDHAVMIVARCNVLQQEMLQWANGPSTRTFDGTLHDLFEIYQRDEDSPFHRLRLHTRRSYEHDIKMLDRHAGSQYLENLSGRDFLRWYREFRLPAKEGKPERIRRAHGLMSMLRIVISYGVVLEVPHCARLRVLLSEISFEQAKPRTQRLTADHATAIRTAAHAAGLPSIALAQALQFELTLRQKDVIGEWVPIEDPGVSAITDRRQKWLRGLRWEQIDANFILKHASSKTDFASEFDLKLYPMVMDELERVPLEKRAGPLIISEATGQPYRTRYFADQWRAIATAAKVPANVWNMDSRAGGITEATDADASLEDIRHQAGHSNVVMTQRYSRNTAEKTSNVARLRVAHRTKDKT